MVRPIRRAEIPTSLPAGNMPIGNYVVVDDAECPLAKEPGFILEANLTPALPEAASATGTFLVQKRRLLRIR